MTTTTYTETECDRDYQKGFFETVTINNGKYEYAIDAFVGKIDYVVLGRHTHTVHKNYDSPYSVVDWLGHYTVVIFPNDEDVTRIAKEFYNLKDAVDFYLAFERGSYCEKVIYQERELRNGEHDHNVVTYA